MNLRAIIQLTAVFGAIAGLSSGGFVYADEGPVNPPPATEQEDAAPEAGKVSEKKDEAQKEHEEESHKEGGKPKGKHSSHHGKAFRKEADNWTHELNQAVLASLRSSGEGAKTVVQPAKPAHVSRCSM